MSEKHPFTVTTSKGLVIIRQGPRVLSLPGSSIKKVASDPDAKYPSMDVFFADCDVASFMFDQGVEAGDAAARVAEAWAETR